MIDFKPPSPSPRARLAVDKVMDTAERLYAERGFAGVSINQISEAAGQRNKSVVQYHFSNRDELIKSVIARHLVQVDRLRMRMVTALAVRSEVSSRDRMECLVLPSVQHLIDLGTPSWYARFMAQVLVEPSLRDYTLQSHLDSESVRLLRELPGGRRRGPSGELVPQLATMVRHLVVHMCAELEYELAHGSIPAQDAEPSWRKLGEQLVTATTALSTSFLG